MAETYRHSEDGKRILAELKDKGVTDLDDLVRMVTADKTPRPEPRMLVCNNLHYCLVVKEV